MEKRNSQLEHGQPMEQTRGWFCTCDSGVTRCQSQHQNEVDVALASEFGSCQSNVCIARGYKRLQNPKIH